MSIWMAIRPGPTGTRILATAKAHETLLKAKLLNEPRHPRALPALLEALALWQGETVRAALVADASDDGCGTRLVHDAFPLIDPTPLYHLDVVHGRRRRHRDPLDGMGDFRDLRQLLLFEVAR